MKKKNLVYFRGYIMKLALVLVTFMITVQAIAASTYSKSFDTLVRIKRGKLVERSIQIKDLISKDSFSGKFFKIVHQKSNEAIKFNAGSDLTKRAATAYYHLTKARTFWVNEMKSSYVQGLDQVTIRLQLTNEYHDDGHFAHDNFDPQFNNAKSIEASAGDPDLGIAPWGKEIWFRPMKKVKLTGAKGEEYQVKGLLKDYRKRMHQSTFQQFLTRATQQVVTPRPGFANTLIPLLTSTAVIELAYQSLGLSYKLFSPKYYYLDAGMIPEIIYHEFSHIALSDNLELIQSTSVNEGIADYFAALIADNKKLATKIKKYGNARGKNAKNKESYQSLFETSDYANTDFVLALFWDIQTEFGANGRELIYKTRKRIDSNSDIRTNLLDALLDECRDSCKSPANDRYRLFRIFNNRGL
jgi:hypothetical protein